MSDAKFVTARIPTLVLIVVVILLFPREKTFLESMEYDGSDSELDLSEVGFQIGSPNGPTFAMGQSHVCVIQLDGLVRCAGLNTHGQLGPQTSIGNSLLDLTEFGTPMQISAGTGHSCLLTDRSLVLCWGKMGLSNIEVETESYNSEEAHLIPLDEPIKSISSGEDHACALSHTGTSFCWNSLNNHPMPIFEISSERGGVELESVSLSNGDKILCLISIEREAYCSNSPTSEMHHHQGLTRIPGIGSISSISINQDLFCILRVNGDVHCTNSTTMKNQLYTGKNIDPSSIHDLKEIRFHNVSVISSGHSSVCLVSSNNSAFCSDNSGNFLESRPSVAKAISVGGFGSCMIPDQSGELICDSISKGSKEFTFPENPKVSLLDSDGDGLGDHFDDYPMDSSRTEICRGGYYGKFACIPSPQGAFVSGPRSTEYSLCPPGFFQDEEASQTCKISPPGTYSEGFGNHAPTPCQAGTFSNITGASSPYACVQASIGNFSPISSSMQIPCPLGTFQPDPGSPICQSSTIGHFTEGIGSSSQLPCPIGTFNPNEGADGSSSCLDSDSGHSVPIEGSPNQFPCQLGTYQSEPGQDHCIDADPGNFVPDIGSSSQTECPAGTYQPEPMGQECHAVPQGTYSLPGSLTPFSECPPGSYIIGESGCTESSPGHFVPSGGEAYQTECPAGTYQPELGRDHCLYAQPGYFVASPGAISEEPCLAGTFQSDFGSTNCDSVPEGLFSLDASSETLEVCPIGSYFVSNNSTACILADPGHFVQAPGSLSQEPCQPGTFQPELGQDHCIDADPGHFVVNEGASSQEPCPPGTFNPDVQSSNSEECRQTTNGSFSVGGNGYSSFCLVGTYQPLPAQDHCIDADPGHFVANEGAASQEQCQAGEYQPLPGQDHCIGADPGHYSSTNASISQDPCPIGTNNSNFGSNNISECLGAQPGFFSHNQGSEFSIPCPKGTYNPSIGASSSTNCIEADPGHSVPNEGSASQEPCQAGEYQPLSGQDHCIGADPGHFVYSNGSSTQRSCTLGTFQEFASQQSCVEAFQGRFTQSTRGATEQFKCPEGTHNTLLGSFSSDDCIQNSPGHYSSEGSPMEIPCPPGTFQPNSSSSSCEIPPIGYFVYNSGSLSPIPCGSGGTTLFAGASSSIYCIIDQDGDTIPDEEDDWPHIEGNNPPSSLPTLFSLTALFFLIQYRERVD